MAAKPRYRIGSDGTNVRLVAPDRPQSSSRFMRGEHSPFFFNWTPALRDSREDVRASYIRAAARAIDSIHNSGWLAGAVNQSIGSMVGTGLRLAAKPDVNVLRWDEKTANDWTRLVEWRFEGWSGTPMECDAAGRHSLGQQARTVLLSFYTHGEALALLPMIRRPGSQTRTKVRLLPPHKLSQQSDGVHQYQGITLDAWGMPTSYLMWLRHDQQQEVLTPVRARDAGGRPQVIHVFEGEADQVRGITPMAPALRIVRQYDQLSDGTLTTALLQTIFAATITSDAPTTDVLNALQDQDEQGVGGGGIADFLGAKAQWYEKTKIDLGAFSKIAHLFPGEELKFTDVKTPNDNYEPFAKLLLREIARCLGMTFETLTGDYSGATYSSVRMATSEIWPVILARRANIAGRFYQQVYEAWLEEEIESGRLPFPGGIYAFFANREAASRADWRGPAKPQADDLKAAKAHELYKRMGVMSDEMICNDLGVDFEDVYQQRAHEKKLREQLGLPDGDTLQSAEDEALTNKLVSEGAE